MFLPFPAIRSFRPARSPTEPFLQPRMLSVSSTKALAMPRSKRFSQGNLFSAIPSCKNHNQVMFSSLRGSSSESVVVSPVDVSSKDMIAKPLPNMDPGSRDFKDSSKWELQKAHSPDLPIEVRFEHWIAHHKRFYKDAADNAFRFSLFKESVEFVDSFNADPDRTHTAGLNNLADFTDDEYRIICGIKEPHEGKATTAAPFKYDNMTDMPESVDLRSQGVVTPVKDEDQYGSCWAFSDVADTEGTNGKYKARPHNDDLEASLFQGEEVDAGLL